MRIIYLKSRRIQATTGAAAEFFHATAFTPGVHTVVLAHDAVSTEKIFKIYDRLYRQHKNFGPLALPRSRAPSDRIYFEYGGDPESSFIQVHTAGNTNFGRSFRITNLHFSEYPYYANPAASRASAMAAVTRTADTTVVIEGTSKTIGDDFHHLWQEVIDPSIACEWIGIFMAWWEHPDNRMQLAVPQEQFANSLSREERELMGRFNLSYEQLQWRRYVILNEFRGDIQTFQREHPATPEEAFTAASRNRFSVPHIQRMPVMRTAMVGELGIEQVGVDKRIYFQPNSVSTGALRVYKMPEKGHSYAYRADPSGGADINLGKGQADPDWAVTQVSDRDTGEQVATLRLRCMPGQFGKEVARLCRFYNMAQVAVERTGAGVGSLEELLDGQGPDLVRKAVQMALKGDVAALRLCLERLCPIRRERSIYLPLPEARNAAEAAAALTATLKGITDGEITPGEGVAISQILEVQKGLLEAAREERTRQDIEQESKALESELGGKPCRL